MKNFLLLLFLSVASISIVTAQAPSKVLFKKYENKSGVDLTISNEISILTIENDDEDKNIKKLFKSISNECIKLLKNKKYTTLVYEKDEDNIIKICSYEEKGFAEMCVLEIDGDTLTFTSTLMNNQTPKDAMKEIKNTKINN